jgi:hypothetical protein
VRALMRALRSAFCGIGPWLRQQPGTDVDPSWRVVERVRVTPKKRRTSRLVEVLRGVAEDQPGSIMTSKAGPGGWPSPDAAELVVHTIRPAGRIGLQCP